MKTVSNIETVKVQRDEVIKEAYQKVVCLEVSPINQDWTKPGDNFKKLSIYNDTPVIASSSTTLICKV